MMAPWAAAQKPANKTYGDVKPWPCPKCGQEVTPWWGKLRDTEMAAWQQGPALCSATLIEEAACRLLES